MPDWIYHDGHIGWTLFAVLVYTGVLLLAIDYVWRRMTLAFVKLAAGGVVLWSAGVLLLAVML